MGATERGGEQARARRSVVVDVCVVPARRRQRVVGGGGDERRRRLAAVCDAITNCKQISDVIISSRSMRDAFDDAMRRF